MSMNLELDVLQENSYSDVDFTNAVLDLVESDQKFIEADQKLKDVLQGYENLEAIQSVIEKHGYTDALKDLFGEQISQETLSVSEEGFFSKVKEAAVGAGKAAKSFFENLFKVTNGYGKQFENAKNWIKVNGDKNPPPKKPEGSGDNATYYITISSCIKALNDIEKMDNGDILNMTQKLNSQGGFGNFVLNKYAKKVDLTQCNSAQLVAYCDDVVKNMAAFNTKLKDFTDAAKLDKEAYKVANAAVAKEENQKYESVRDDAQKDAKLIKLKHTKINTKLDRIKTLVGRKIGTYALNSCKALNAELRRRGFKSEFNPNGSYGNYIQH